jgi:hypothetical protein
LKIGTSKIGSLCIIDTKVREFSTIDKMNLLDLSLAVAILMKERKEGMDDNNGL